VGKSNNRDEKRKDRIRIRKEIGKEFERKRRREESSLKQYLGNIDIGKTH
jgi:hypothetical protein